MSDSRVRAVTDERGYSHPLSVKIEETGRRIDPWALPDYNRYPERGCLGDFMSGKYIRLTRRLFERGYLLTEPVFCRCGPGYKLISIGKIEMLETGYKIYERKAHY